MTELSAAGQIAVWDRIAQQTAAPEPEPDPQFVRIVEALEVRQRQALDLGCGCGRHLRWLAGNGWLVTGLDWSQAAVSRAGQSLRSAGLAGTVVRGDITKLNLSLGSFPLVVATDVLHYNRLSWFRRSLVEIKQILKIGGQAVISLPVRGSGLLPPGSWIEEGTLLVADGPEAGLPRHYFSEAEVRDCCRQFREVQIQVQQRAGLPAPIQDSAVEGGAVAGPVGIQLDRIPWDGSISISVTGGSRHLPPAGSQPAAGPGENDVFWVLLKG